jgi:amino acid transporter
LLLYAFFGPVSFPGVNLFLALSVTGIFMLIHAFVSGQMVVAMPRSGFDYVFVSRVVHPVAGFSNSFAFFFFQGTIGGVFYTFINQYIASYFNNLGLITGNASYTNISTLLSQPTYIIIVGSILNVVVTLITLGGLRIGKRAILITQGIGWIGLLVALGIIASNSHGNFTAAWDKYLGSQVPSSNVISLATSHGLVYVGGLGVFLAATFFSLFSTLGYHSIGYLGGEVKKASSTIVKSMVIAVVVTLLVVGVGMAILFNTVGYDFLVSAAYLNVVTVNVTASAYYTTVATMLFPNVGVATLIYVGLVMWVFVTIVGLFFLLTRTIFAWSFDGAVPHLFSNVSERFHSPTWAVILIGVLFEIGVIVSSQTVPVALLVDLGLFLFLSYSVNTLASALLPWLKRDLFDSSPRIVNMKLGPIPLITLTGGITTVFFWAISYGIATNPVIAGNVTPATGLSIVVVLLVGASIYYVSKFYRKSKGQDLSLVYKEIPPE